MATSKKSAEKKPYTGRRIDADTITGKYSHVIPGTLKYDPEHRKQMVQIQTFGLNGKKDGGKRKVATSDLHQTFFSEKVKAEFDKLPAKDRQKIKAGIKAAIKGKGTPRKPKAAPKAEPAAEIVA